MSVSKTQLVHLSPRSGYFRGEGQAVDAIVKLDADKVTAAMQAAKRNGGDEVFYQVGNDTYVATARSMNAEFQKKFDANPAWNPADDQVGVRTEKSRRSPASALTKMAAKGFDNEFQSGSEYASSKDGNWGQWLGSLFGQKHRKAWERMEKPTYDADAFSKFGQKLEAHKAYR